MNYRTLGRTGLVVSEVGFGAWGIGGAHRGAVGYGRTDDNDSMQALRRAFDRGITFFDTADLYGFGHSERLIGAALKDLRDQVLIATKVGFLGPDGPQDFSPAHIRTSIDGSLRRLQTLYVDLYQLHNPPVGLLERDPAVGGTLDALVAEGKIRAWGVSVKSPADGLAFAKCFQPAAIQVNFNMVDQRAVSTGLFGLCATRGIGIIGRTPLCYGFLSAKYNPQTTFDALDHRARWPAEQRALWADAPRKLAPVIDGSARSTPAQVAIRYCLSYPAVSTVIPGMLTAEQVEENAAASDMGSLAASERLAIEQTYLQHEFFLRPVPLRPA